ncbi:MAG: ATP-binding protein [Pseudohongiella sp.]|nr:ATP-binding protein [Pseudohongiella sp.]
MDGLSFTNRRDFIYDWTHPQTVGSDLGYHYISLDDNNQLAAAQTDPVGFVAALPEKTILDEIQRAPNLFTSLKASVDQNRQPGRYILTGSVNIMLLSSVADSLAGRIEIMRLRPLARCEVSGHKPRFLEQLFQSDFLCATGAGKLNRLGEKLAQTICDGGYPAALARSSEIRRANWYRDFITTLIQRDIQDIAHIKHLEVLPRLLSVAASQTARLFNGSDIASPLSISRPTIREYLTLLEQIFLIEQLQPWHNNRLSRLVKTPKMHMADTGLACSLLGLNSNALWQDKPLLGQLLETWIYIELRKHADWSEREYHFFHYRDKDKVEVDIVIQQGRQLAGVEIKASATVTAADFKGLIKLREACAEQFVCGLVFYDGDSVLPFGERLFAVPISIL